MCYTVSLLLLTWQGEAGLRGTIGDSGVKGSKVSRIKRKENSSGFIAIEITLKAL